MKIGIVIEKFDVRRGGAEQWTYYFVQRLLARGHEVHLVSSGFSALTERLNVRRHPLVPGGSRLALAAQAEEVLGGLHLDVIHDMAVGWHCDLFHSHDGSRLAQWAQKLHTLPRWLQPVKRSMIGVLPRYAELRTLLRRQLGDPRVLVLALSQMVADDFIRYHGIRPERIRLVYNGVDTQRFSPALRDRHRGPIREQLGIGDHELMLLFLGHDFVRKGLSVAIRATQRLTAQRLPVRLVVVGGRHTARVQNMARRFRAGPAVTFVGPVDDSAGYYAAADVCVLPTFYDPCSLVVLEAAACGLPSVTTRFNGAGELFSDGQDGYILPDPADDEALAGRVRLLLEPALRESMGRAARRLACAHTLEENCRQIEAVYHEIVAGRYRASA